MEWAGGREHHHPAKVPEGGGRLSAHMGDVSEHPPDPPPQLCILLFLPWILIADAPPPPSPLSP